MKEVWKQIKGYEGKYEVSNLGRVRSVERIGTRPNPRTGKDMAYPMKSRVITPKNHPSGYQQVALYKDGKQSFLVHRLVADTFVDGYFVGAVVNHIDEDKHNNRADNLEWVTQQKNVNHGTGVERMTKSIHKRLRKIGQYDMDGNLIATFTTSGEASRQTGISRSAISNALRGKNASSGGYRWRYIE